ncbi:phosphoglycerate kinase [Candidatus Woesearchaeota archaeon]|nr:phosphoglycerate kinase [Candidatus Woesearchaeota archaeon]
MPFKTLEDLDFEGGKVIVRLDLNVSLGNDGRITDSSRIRASLPTIRYLIGKKASKIVLMSHLGRPDGKVVEGLRMDHVAVELQKLLKRKVVKLNDCIGVKSIIDSSNDRIFLLENLRFYPEEEENDATFAGKLSEVADFYVNDAFGCCHRAHASVAAITGHLPSCAGLLLQKEIKSLSGLFNPEHPFVIVLGGAKVSDKVGIIRNLGKKADKILVGGAMAFTFLKAKGVNVGKSRVELDKLDVARGLLEYDPVLPTDFVIADRMDPEARSTISSYIPDSSLGLDIGPESVRSFIAQISRARTVVWNGPMGVFEMDKFAKGTRDVGKAISGSKGRSVAGGGDTLAAIEKLKLRGFTHKSTGGGAMLEFLEGRELPAIKALQQSAKKFAKRFFTL